MPPVVPSSLGGKLGLAAVVLFAPGGFVLGAAIAWGWWRERQPPA
ncbi:hypothetical protein [Sphingomonas sp.]